MNSTKDAHELQKKISRDEQGAWKDGASDGLLKIHASSAELWSARIHKLQVLGSEHVSPGTYMFRDLHVQIPNLELVSSSIAD